METEEKQYRLVAKTFQGLEDVLAEELAHIGATGVEKQNRAVLFNGDKAMMYRANYQLRTAISILKPIASFTANDEDALYKEISLINWANYMTTEETFSVAAVTFSKVFNHSKFVSLKVKDA
ncbi:MAG: THUMP domain-containing protein, partial [Salinivirgaceae bacterium]|nr:THUMP domain-containing protein [Salinivirgaceae bacterium]